MLEIASLTGTFSFSNISALNKPVNIGRVRLGYQEAEKKEEQYTILYKGDTFKVNGATVFEEIEKFKNKYPSQNLDLSLILNLLFPSTTGTAVDITA